VHRALGSAADPNSHRKSGPSCPPCAYGSVKDDANDASLKQKADTFVHGAVDTITRHFVDHTPYHHYSLLTTIEDNWNLGHIGHAGDTGGGVKPVRPAFTGRP